ncbi:glutathione S-transferase II [Metarhizium album ARSEF 1941]|uniref:Glutathione S-transferase II n=1 Tax=Metarhizium album (strain ARSEF 1941) TaxID=1081103 RepID=A0A0B2X538_METAS|nr:glutathione S-transferase II [Metarhizium album ARSEF 1941]KHO00570.1 glutathione S-transferase II [Metarhizium album ARSEF 1941]
MATKTDIVLYTASTPNGIKASIALEELGLQYKPWFLEINPNGRIPALTDALDGKKVRVFESGAILEYLADRYDKDHKISYPRDTPEHWEVTSWLMWQMGGLEPMQGQANHFKRYAPEKIEYGINRYGNETRRLYRTMDDHLAKSPHGFLVGDRVTIADISCWGWVAAHTWAGVSLDEFPHLDKWLKTLLKRPGFEKGRHVPQPHTAFDNDSLTEEELNAKAAGARNWVQGGMKADAQK